MKAKKVAATIAACGLVAAMALGGTLAYLTDNESHTNSIRVSGDVKADLVEENWDQTDSNGDGVPDDAEKMVPNQEVSKDPKIINTGKNDAYAFIRLTVPVKDVTKIEDDGTLITREDNDNAASNTPTAGVFHEPQDIFYFKQADDEISVHANNWGDGWLRLAAEEFNVEKTATAAGADGDYSSSPQAIGQAVYVFAYKTVLEGAGDSEENGGETSTLFDKVQIKNIIENELASDQIQNIKVEAFMVQADNIIGSDGNPIVVAGDDTDASATTKLKEIYDIFVEQNGTVESDGSFTWDTYQDSEHGQTEKEADTNNQRDLNNTANRLQTSYSISADKTILTPGETATITPTITQRAEGASGSIQYESLDTDVATVTSGGVVTAKEIGDTTIVATLDGVKTSVHISVQEDHRPVTGNDPDNDADPRPIGTTEP